MPFAAVGAGLAVAGAGMDIYNGISSAGAAGQASKEQQAAINAANQQLTLTNNQAQSYLAPYNQTGDRANNLLSMMMSNPSAFQGQFMASPGYQYNLNQQQGAIQNSAAAKGGLTGGNTLMALQGNASGLANQDYQQFISNLMGLQGLGAQVGNNQASIENQFGQNYANNTLGIGASQSAATVAQNNDINSGIGGAINSLSGITGGQYQGAANALGGVFGVNQGPVSGGTKANNYLTNNLGLY